MNPNIELLLGVRALLNIACGEINQLMQEKQREHETIRKYVVSAPKLVRRVPKRSASAASPPSRKTDGAVVPHSPSLDVQETAEASTTDHIPVEDETVVMHPNNVVEHAEADVADEADAADAAVEDAINVEEHTVEEERRQKKRERDRRYREKVKARMMQNILQMSS